MTNAPQPIPCRLSVILAREAPVAVIFRRGPSKLVELIKWHTDTDTFERGQWFKGRIYEHCSDLSPDGALLIYFAAKWQLGRHFDKDHFPAWTAISRLPWLTALALWPSPGLWDAGGGLFIDEGTVWLIGHHTKPHKDHRPQGLRISTEPDQHIAATRFFRDGWVPTKNEPPHVWERTDTYRWMSIVADGNPFQHHTSAYSVLDRSRGTQLPLKGATWADWDQQGRLVFARHGKPFAGDFDHGRQMTPRELADFNDDTFEPKVAPAWAQAW
jgi:hypothetical protein